MAILYNHSIENPPQNPMVVFKMRDSIPSARYSPICNVLRLWKTSLIPIRVYRLYDNKFMVQKSSIGLVIYCCIASLQKVP